MLALDLARYFHAIAIKRSAGSRPVEAITPERRWVAAAARLVSARSNSPMPCGRSSAAGDVKLARIGLRIVGAMQPSAGTARHLSAGKGVAGSLSFPSVERHPTVLVRLEDEFG